MLEEEWKLWDSAPIERNVDTEVAYRIEVCNSVHAGGYSCLYKVVPGYAL
jgi:hypothetical protein